MSTSDIKPSDLHDCINDIKDGVIRIMYHEFSGESCVKCGMSSSIRIPPQRELESRGLTMDISYNTFHGPFDQFLRQFDLTEVVDVQTERPQ